jgi:hypothetical protein
MMVSSGSEQFRLPEQSCSTRIPYAFTYDNLQARRHDLGDRKADERPAVLRRQRAEAEGDAADRREQD